MNACAAARKYDSVQQDWRAILPEAKSSLFADHCGQLENAYLMLSVQLNEAISARDLGDVFRVRQGAGVLEELCARLALRINAVLHAMGQ